jgi:hypothetical protein
MSIFVTTCIKKKLGFWLSEPIAHSWIRFHIEDANLWRIRADPDPKYCLQCYGTYNVEL